MKWLACVVALVFVLGLYFTWDSKEPLVDWLDTPAVVGGESRINLRLTDTGKGLRSVTITAVQEGRRRLLLSEAYPGSGLPWEDRTVERTLAVSLDSLSEADRLSEGSLDIEVVASDQPDLWFFNSTLTEIKPVRLDLTPPRIEVLSGNHYIRQGGAETILYRLREETRASGVQVGDHRFRGYRFGPDAIFVCLFALKYDEPVDVPMLLWAEDLAGNQGSAPFHKEVIPVRFRKRTMEVTDSFIEKVSADILSNVSEVSRKDSLLNTFLEINGRLRELNHDQILKISQESSDRILWSQPFVQLSNSKVESAFADERTYLYKGRAVDQQTHQGFDLASTILSPVEAANDGLVIYSGYLGIYGNCVIVDHGLGLMSLYGHLSSLEIETGDPVTRGQILGRSGETGLAGGDHLHFSMILQGVQVNPLEWWDPKWLELHIFSKLGKPGPS